MIHFSTKRLASALAGALLVLTLQAARCAEATTLKLPAIFGDNMVLQQQQSVPVWGWSAPGANVSSPVALHLRATGGIGS